MMAEIAVATILGAFVVVLGVAIGKALRVRELEEELAHVYLEICAIRDPSAPPAPARRTDFADVIADVQAKRRRREA